MKINFNYAAMRTQTSLQTSENRYSVSGAHLAAGKRVTSAKENPSGLAMSRRMNAQIRSMQEAANNVQNSINVIQTTDGALAEVQDILQRMSELSVRAATGTLEEKDREYIQQEIEGLKEEVQRIRDTTQFNGQSLIDGSFAPKAYSLDGSTPKAKILEYSGIEAENIWIEGIEVKTTEVTSSDPRSAAYNKGARKLDPETLDLSDLSVKDQQSTGGKEIFEKPFSGKIRGDVLEITDNAGRSVTLQISQDMNTSDQVGVEFPYNREVNDPDDLTRYGMTAQVGSNEGALLNVVIPDISLASLGIRFVDASTVENAQESISDIKAGLQRVSKVRSDLGAMQNRMEHTETTLNVNEENTTASFSTIIDADMAEEMIDHTNYQVLTQVGTSILAQANQRAADMLQLIQ